MRNRGIAALKEVSRSDEGARGDFKRTPQSTGPEVGGRLVAMTSRRSLHDNDFYAWRLEQAAPLRAGRVGEAGLATIAEEIESVGKTEKRELVSRLTQSGDRDRYVGG